MAVLVKKNGQLVSVGANATYKFELPEVKNLRIEDGCLKWDEPDISNLASFNPQIFYEIYLNDLCICRRYGATEFYLINAANGYSVGLSSSYSSYSFPMADNPDNPSVPAIGRNFTYSLLNDVNSFKVTYYVELRNPNQVEQLYTPDVYYSKTQLTVSGLSTNMSGKQSALAVFNLGTDIYILTRVGLSSSLFAKYDTLSNTLTTLTYPTALISSDFSNLTQYSGGSNHFEYVVINRKVYIQAKVKKDDIYDFAIIKYDFDNETIDDIYFSGITELQGTYSGFGATKGFLSGNYIYYMAYKKASSWQYVMCVLRFNITTGIIEDITSNIQDMPYQTAVTNPKNIVTYITLKDNCLYHIGALKDSSDFSFKIDLTNNRAYNLGTGLYGYMNLTTYYSVIRYYDIETINGDIYCFGGRFSSSASSSFTYPYPYSMQKYIESSHSLYATMMYVYYEYNKNYVASITLNYGKTDSFNMTNYGTISESVKYTPNSISSRTAGNNFVYSVLNNTLYLFSGNSYEGASPEDRYTDYVRIIKVEKGGNQ